MRERKAFTDIPRGGRVLIIGENEAGTEISFRLMAKVDGTPQSFDCSRADARAFLRDTAKHTVKRIARPAKPRPAEARS